MSAFKNTVDAAVFTRFPGYVRGLVIAHEVDNRASPEDLVRLLREAEDGVRQQLKVEDLGKHPRINAWREAYRAFGAKPAEYRSSIEALVRRALRNEPLPSISALVDIGTIVSLRHLIPAGGHAIDVMKADMSLRFATGTETFVALRSDQVEKPLPGEVIFAEGDTVLTRRWTWRQGDHGSTQLETRAIEFNIDGLPPVPADEIKAACVELAELVGRFCGGRQRCELLTSESPSAPLGGF
jgi:DNA/RNA-binding domain of Phe-tRNA-synthetase-like protein